MNDVHFDEQSESLFTLDEIFFSRTNEKGIINSGNSIFQRVSEYSWEELLNKPHNLIRHSDMPKGVFYLFWQIVKSGAPISAYVKNRSKTGKYYWVFALALPISDGYLSIRIKPSSTFLKVIETEYTKLVQLEKNKNLSPKESSEILLADLKALGFLDYHSFMVVTLKAELESRQKSLQRSPILVLTKLDEVLSSGQQLQMKAQEILKAYNANARVPLNLEIKTTSIGNDGAPLGVVASKYESMAKDIRTEILEFVKSSETTMSRISQAQFSVCMAWLESEVYALFSSDANSGPVDIQRELQILSQIRNDGITGVIQSLKQVENEFSGFEIKCASLKTASTGLEIVRLTGKIEVSKINDRDGEIKLLMEELTQFRQKLSVALSGIEVFSKSLKSKTQELSREISSAFEQDQKST